MDLLKEYNVPNNNAKNLKREKIESLRVESGFRHELVSGDALVELEKLPDGCIDVLLTDSPYGVNYSMTRSKNPFHITRRGMQNDGKEEAFGLLAETCKILVRKMAGNSHLYFFCSWQVYVDFVRIIGEYFKIKTTLVWDKGIHGVGDTFNDWGNRTELVIYATRGTKGTNKRRGNILNFPRLNHTNMIHPTQKPTPMLEEILSVSAGPGDFVVDPFMGSGSTIKACINRGLDYMGVEIDDEMYVISKKWLEL